MMKNIERRNALLRHCETCETCIALKLERSQGVREGLLKPWYGAIPDYMEEALIAWVETSRPTGDFLWVVLTNGSIREYVERADENNLKAIKEWVWVMVNLVPGACWGSRDKVEQWQGRIFETHVRACAALLAETEDLEERAV